MNRRLRWGIAWTLLFGAFLFVVLVRGASEPTRPAPSADPTQSSSPPTSTSVPASTPIEHSDALEKRILEFEQSYRILDPNARKAALEPYVTSEFLDVLFPSGVDESSYLESLRKDESRTLDLTTAIVIAEQLEDEAHILRVFTQIAQTEEELGSDPVIRLISHTTYWTKDNSGVWRVQSEAVN